MLFSSVTTGIEIISNVDAPAQPLVTAVMCNKKREKINL